MSRLTARGIFDQVIGRPAFMASEYVTRGSGQTTSEVTSDSLFMADLADLSRADPIVQEALAVERRGVMMAAYDFDVGDDEDEKPFAFSNGYAVIPIHGVLINRFSYSWGFATGYNFIRDQLAAAMKDDDVKAIIFDVNSYGGTVRGCAETADAIYTAAQEKPCMSVVDSTCFSAAYMLASQCGGIVITPTSEVGSIGVVLMHTDYSKMMEQIGISTTFIFAGKHKIDGNSYQPLTDQARATFQDAVNACYDDFVKVVVRGRGLTDEAVRATEAACYRASDALAAKLIDAVRDPDDTVESMFAKCEDVDDDEDDDLDDDEDVGDDEPGDDDRPKPKEAMPMPPVKTTPAAPDPNAEAQAAEANAAAIAQATTTARANERARISAITTHAEASGRTALATHLALNTDMTAEAAGAILAASPKEAAPAPKADGAEMGPAFKKLMAKSKNPEVGASGGSGDEEEEDDKVAATPQANASRIVTALVGKPRLVSNQK